jgi:serine/threonine protein kinase
MDTQPIANCCPRCQTPLPPDAPQGLCPKCLFAAVATPTEADQPAGNRPAPPPLTEIAAAFPQLEILEFIGQGGMGFVFKARQPKLDRLVALKILPQSLAADPTFAERFNREARLLARLNHPGIVTVHDFGVAVAAGILPAVEPGVPPGGKGVEISGTLPNSEAIASPTANPDGKMPPSRSGQRPDATQFYYLLMEFVDGVNLRQAMQAGRFTPAQALAIVPKICEALHFAHNEGVLHRDIKPENILLDAKGRVKIADFGIAKLMGNAGRADLRVSQAAQQHRPTEPNLTQAGKTLGSPNYMAPEQLEHPGEVDHRADIYSLGVVFYEMLTGELPLGRFAPPSQKSAADPRVDEVVLRALEKERERRQHSAGEVKTQVETITGTPVSGSSRGDEAQIEKSESRKQKAEIAPRFSRTAIVGAVLILIPLLAFGYSFLVTIVSPGTKPWEMSVLRFWDGVLKLLGIAALVATTILGWIAVAHIRRSAGKLYGLWLAVFDGLLFPLLALDGAIVGAVIIVLRLLHQVFHDWTVAPIIGSALLLAPAVFGIIVLADFLIIRRVWRAVNQPVGGGTRVGAAPAMPLRGIMLGLGKRLALVFVVGAILGEAFNRITIHWRESEQELSMLPFLVLSVMAVLWAARPVFYQSRPRPGSILLWLGLSVLLWFGLGACYVAYSIYLAPNLGLYSEPDWMVDNAGWQRQIRVGSAKHLWRRPLVSPQFASTNEVMLSLDDEQQTRLVDMDTGRQALRSGLGASELIEWARGEKLDVAAWMKAGRLSVEGLDLWVVPVSDEHWDKDSPQVVADYWLLERNPAKPTTVLWPLADHWQIERHMRRDAMPEWLLASETATFYFRSREGGMGILQITGFTDDPHGVKLRYKLVQPGKN